MTYYYCTYFNNKFLNKGLALYNSLLKHSPHSFVLFILCLDDQTYNLLTILNLKYVNLIKQIDFEDPELLQAKSNRQLFEYYWTISPSLPLYILKNYPEINLITYLDADLYFFSSPKPIFEKFNDNSILLIPHNLPPAKKIKEAIVGKYNVGLMTFRRDENGLACLNWWRNKCNDWCYATPEPDRFGDQKYLDFFPEKFSGVYILHHHGANLAGWNIRNFKNQIVKKENQVLIAGDPLIFFHFSDYNLYYPFSKFLLAGPLNEYKYILPSPERDLIYFPYQVALQAAHHQLMRVDKAFQAGVIPRPNLIKQFQETIWPLLKEVLLKIIHK